MSQDDEDSDELEHEEDFEDGLSGLEEDPAPLDPEEFDFDDDGDDAGEEDDEDAEGVEASEDSGEESAVAGDAPASGRRSTTARSRKLIDVDEDDEEPGPDVAAPTRKRLRDALSWAFEKEDIEPEVLDRFADHARLMLEENRKTNLTAILDPKEVAAKHYLDSWRLTRMTSLVGRTVLDLGTGPGFPGLPLALSEPHCRVVLCDSRKKKADFNERVIEKLGVRNAQSVWARAEEYLETQRVDVVVVRAVSSVRENVRTVRKVRHSLKELVMLKGASWSREVRAAEREAERLGFVLDTVWEHELPDELGKRAILVYRAPGSM